MRHDDDFDDEANDFDPEWDEDEESEEEDDDVTMSCPSCGAAIYDDAVRCPVCERYLSDAERTTTDQPRWVILTAAVLLGAILWACFR